MKSLIFQGWGVRAILEDRKNMTRRIMKPQPIKENIVIDAEWGKDPQIFITWLINSDDGIDYDYNPEIWKCPFQIGEVIYVKESHYKYGKWIKNGLTKTGRQKWRFKYLSDEVRYFDNPPDTIRPNKYRKEGWYKRSALFMSEKDARLFRRITNIKCERVQDISEEDCVKEGMINKPLLHVDVKYQFKHRWLEINGPDSWDKRVFAYTFERIEKA